METKQNETRNTGAETVATVNERMTARQRLQNRKEAVERARKAHWAALEALAAEVGYKADGLTLWRKLGRVERQMHATAINWCNGEHGVTSEVWEREVKKARYDVAAIFGGTCPEGIRFNSDARGCCLKLDSDKRKLPNGMWHDWGGDGMLAATIDMETV